MEKQKNSLVKEIIITIVECMLYAVSAGVHANYGIMINGISENSVFRTHQ